jgi:hypothetical protein
MKSNIEIKKTRPSKSLTSFGSCLVQNPKSALSAANWISSFYHVAGSTVATAILDAAHHRKASGWGTCCLRIGVHRFWKRMVLSTCAAFPAIKRKGETARCQEFNPSKPSLH